MKLMAAGSLALNHTLSHGVRFAVVPHTIPLLRLWPLLRFLQRFSSLAELSVTPLSDVIMSPHIDEKLVFPPKLNVLELHFPKACRLPESQILMGMTVIESLSIQGSISFPLLWKDFNFPSTLRSLTFRPQITSHAVSLTESSIKALPRGLTELSIAYTVDPGFLADTLRLPLTSLTIQTMAAIPIEFLPYTLTTLNLERCTGALTTCHVRPDANCKFLFPWQAFYPRLVSLWLCPSDLQMSHIHSLRTIVFDSMLEPSTADDFIAGSSWDIESLHSPKADSPLRYVQMPDLFWKNSEIDLLLELGVIAPYLKHIRFGSSYCGPLSCLPFIKGVTQLSLHEDPGSEPLPASLTSLTYDSSLSVCSLPPSLTSLECGELMIRPHPGQPGYFGPGDFSPPLISLRLLRSLSSCLVSALPTTLQELEMCLYSHHWDLVATRLVSLRRLKLSLPSDWFSLHPLERSNPLTWTLLNS